MVPSRTLLVISGAIVGLVVVAMVVVALAGGARQSFAPGTPEATIQDYLAAFEADDADGAYRYFSAEVQGEMTFDEFRREADRHFTHDPGNRRSVYIDRVDGEGDRVGVHLTVEEFYGDGLGVGSYRSERSIRMVREQGAWRIDEPLVWLDPMF